MSKLLPERPNMGQLKKQAKDLLDAVHAGDAEAVTRLDSSDKAEEFALHDAQRLIAREYGFPSWAKLRLHVETRTDETAEARLIQASLDGDDEAVRFILTERPALAKRSMYIAASLGDGHTLGDALQRKPGLAKLKGGPRGWEPLQYLCFGRCGSGDTERAAAASALLALGADPNAAHIDPRWPDSPQAVLYGATGVNNHAGLARVLLEAGAEPNDCESRYHAAEKNHVACLEVLGEFGADFSGKDKVWGNTPLYFLFGWQSPAIQVKRGVEWLLDHGADPSLPCGPQADTALHRAVSNGWDKEFVGRLLDCGANPGQSRKDGRSAHTLAVIVGRDDIAQFLRERGATEDSSTVDRFLGACMRADSQGARACIARDSDLLDRISPQDRKLVFLAAREGRAAALTLLAEFGFDLKAADENGATPLHWAAWHGQADAVKVLIAVGAELNRRERIFDAAPLGWCDHGWENCRDPKGDYARVAELLLDAGAEISRQFQPVAPMRVLLKRRGLLRA